MTASEPAQAAPAPGRVLAAFIAGQIGLHAAMAALRMTAALQTLREGGSPWAVGLLMALFAAAPMALAMPAGRLADRHGYHRPVRIAVVLMLAAALVAVLATFVPGWPRFALLCAAASLAGAGANMGMLTIQRAAGLLAQDTVERVRVFSWLSMAPSFSNVLGPVVIGFVIDAAGFRWAYALLLLLPLVTLAAGRAVPASAPRQLPRHADTAWDLLAIPHMKRLFAINWLLNACWDVHAFAVPVLAHGFGFTASTVGLVLGTFTAAVTGVRALIPLLAHRLRQEHVVRAAMLGTALAFALYPFARNAWAMAGCAVLLGLALGSTQPMILAALHQLTPEHRHGEALALRSMALNASSTVMPLLFGAAGAAIGAGVLFWAVGGAVGAGSWMARRFEAPA